MNFTLPPGFRFHPTDEELVVQYLKRKLQYSSDPLPASIIPEADVCKSDPWDLPHQDQDQEERFFFSTREIKYPNGNRSNRATQSGYWKATGLDKQILASGTKQPVGMKKTLVFYKGKPPTGARTDWIMHEYRLVTPQSKTTTHGLEKWVLCRIFLKKRGSNSNSNSNTKEDEKEKEKEKEVVKSKPIFYEFLATPKSSSSGSSGITEADAYGHEESSTNCLESKQWL